MRRAHFHSPSAAAQVEGPRARLTGVPRAELRQVQWSSYYHRFFGRVRSGDRVPDAVAPLTLDDSTALLDRVYTPRLRPVARRCVSQMLLYGHRPAPERRDQFERLARCSVAPTGVAEAAPHGPGVAKTALLRWAEREFGLTAPPFPALREEMVNAADDVTLIALPTRLVHDRGAFLVEKDVYLRATVRELAGLVNPENWEQLGEFFAATYREGHANDPGERPPEPWSGVLREDFVASWNSATTSVFQQRLRIEYTVEPDRARSDYALMYEADDQVTVNEGYLEVRRDDALPDGWVAGTMTKKVKFTSSLLNLLCPALISMLLDSQVGGFNNFIRRGAEPAATA
ncbi:MAG: hypothetical protein SF182_21995 [Deltaproteobacteria bacterium]|nr:hypothetical protein [Deltaproteobacteria bacterium]